MKNNNFSYNYYSGANVFIKLFNLFKNESQYIDCVGISYNVNYGSTPIYSYCSELFDAVLRGREMVQGTFVLNHIQSRLLSDFLNELDSSKVGISFLNAAPFAISINFGKDKGHPLIIKECVIISRGQTIQLDSSNILEEYNFVGKEVLQETNLKLEQLDDIKRKFIRTPFVKENNYIPSITISNETNSQQNIQVPAPAPRQEAPVPIIKEKQQKEEELNIDVSDGKLKLRGIKAGQPQDETKNNAITSSNKTNVTPSNQNSQATIEVNKEQNKQQPIFNAESEVQIYGKDKKVYIEKRSFDPQLLKNSNDPAKTKKFLEDLYLVGDEIPKDVKDQLAFMLSKERKGISNNNRPSLNMEKNELEREQASLLWVATNRFAIEKRYTTNDPSYSSFFKDSDELLKDVFSGKTGKKWATYSKDYDNNKYKGAYENTNNKQIKGVIDKFLNGELPNEIFTNTNFVHVNDNLPRIPDWSLSSHQVVNPDKNILGYSGYDSVYVGNALFSYGYNNYYPLLENDYLQLYPGYYDNDSNFMQKRKFSVLGEQDLDPNDQLYYKYSYQEQIRNRDSSQPVDFESNYTYE